MSARLSLKSKPLWLHQQRTSPSFYHPLLFLPGNGGEGVQVEAALLLACSPLLRRTLPSTLCCISSGMTVILPSSTSAALKHLAQIVVQGSVTIAIEALADIGSLLTLLEVDIDAHLDKTTDGKAAARKKEYKLKLSSNSSPRLLTPPRTPPTVSKKLTSGNTTSNSDESSSSTSSEPPSQKTQRELSTSPSPGPALPLSLVISIPMKCLTSKTVQKITTAQGNLKSLSSSDVKAASPEEEKQVLLSPRPCPSRPPVICIFCDIAMPVGTDQTLYLQHLELCTARADLGDDSLQMKPQPESISPGVGYDSLILKKGHVRKKFKYYCDEPSCEREYSNKTHLANHKRGVHGADKLKCRDLNCTSSFVSSKAFYGHMWVKHDIGKGLQCDQCGKKVTSVEKLEDHQRSVHGAPKLQCNEPGCNSAFTHSTDMYRHVQNKHK